MLLSASCSRAGAPWRAAPPGSLAYALGLGMIGVWLALCSATVFGDRFTYYPMIGYFWVYRRLDAESA